jgi:hypothetical protein
VADKSKQHNVTVQIFYIPRGLITDGHMPELGLFTMKLFLNICCSDPRGRTVL